MQVLNSSLFLPIAAVIMDPDEVFGVLSHRVFLQTYFEYVVCVRKKHLLC